MKFLIASPFLANPDTNGAKARILAFMHQLSRDGHEVHFAYMGIDKADPARSAELMRGHCASFTDLRDEAYPWAEPGEDGYQIDDWVSQAQVDGFRALHDRIAPDVTIVNYIFFSRLLEGLNSIKVLDLHDRLARAEQYTSIGQEPKFFYTTEARELQAVARADIALCIQDNEKAYFEKAGVPVFTFGHILPRAYLDRRFSKLQTVGYIGAYNVFNIHAMERLLPEFARLAEEFPDLRLRLGGGICNAIPDTYPFVEKLGHVPTLAEFYGGIDLALNPTLVGTGLKIKTVEALSHGVPLVSTRVGMDGLPALTEFHTAEDIPSIIDILRQLKVREFKELTKLANLSKLAHTEYTETQKATIGAFLACCQDWIAAAAAGQERPAAETATRPVRIADLKPQRLSSRMLHVLNPFHAPPSSDNYLAQPITYQSMADAIDFARDYIPVDVLNLHLPDEEPVAHPVFTHTRALRESSKDHLPDYPRNLPLLRDILDLAAEYEDYDWLVYSNVDIALTPAFYRRVAEYIADGHDAIVINRRTISKRISGLDQLGEAYGQIGQPHPGFDCFVFRRDLVEKFDLYDTLVGVHLIGRMLIWNLLKHARAPLVEKQEHLTFHIGDDVPSKDVGEIATIAHNFRQAARFWDATQAEDGALERINAAAEAAGVSDARKFNVGQLVTPNIHRPSEGLSPSCPVHLHGHFRCGSTFLFRQLRHDPGNMCFYEPFHEDLETFSVDNLDRKKALHSPSNFHKEHDGDWFFKETESLLLEEGRIPGFRAAFGTQFFGDNSPNEEIEAYVDRLVRHAYEAGRRPILQFNRTGMRLEYFTRTFPDHFHLFLLRDLKDQWNSYLRFMRDGNRGFLRSMIACLGRGRKGDRLQALNELVPLYQLNSDRNLHDRYDSIFDLYTFEQLYVCFYYMWMVSLLDAVSFNVPILQMSRTESDPRLQARTDERLISVGLAIDWGQLSTDIYQHDFLGEQTRAACESVVNAMLLERYGADVADRLATAGFAEIAQGFSANATPDPDTLRRLRRAASMDGAELHTLALVLAARVRPAEHEDANITRLVDRPYLMPVLAPGRNRFDVANGGFRNHTDFTFGFSRLEKSHVWTNDKQAGIAVRLPFPATSLKLRVHFAAFSELIEKRARYTFKVNTKQVYQGTCSGWQWLDFEIPPELLNAGRNGSLCITLGAEDEPEEAAANRQLFFAISTLELDYGPLQ